MQGFMLTISVKNIRKNALFNIVTACQLGKISISVEPVYQVKFDLIYKKQLQKWPKKRPRSRQDNDDSPDITRIDYMYN